MDIQKPWSNQTEFEQEQCQRTYFLCVQELFLNYGNQSRMDY